MPPPHPCLAPLPAPLGLRFRALLGLGFVPPPEPRPCVHCAFPRQRHAAWPNGLCAMRQRHAARGMAERALRPAARAWPACRMRAPCHLACARRGLRLPAISPAFIAAVLHASRFATRIAPTVRRHSPHRPLRSGRAVDQALPAALVLPTPTHRVHRCALAGTARAPTRANRTPALSQPSPARPGAICAHPRPATRRASPCRAGPAAVLVIPAKWCGDTIAHTRKLRF